MQPQFGEGNIIIQLPTASRKCSSRVKNNKVLSKPSVYLQDLLADFRMVQRKFIHCPILAKANSFNSHPISFAPGYWREPIECSPGFRKKRFSNYAAYTVVLKIDDNVVVLPEQF